MSIIWNGLVEAVIGMEQAPVSSWSVFISCYFLLDETQSANLSLNSPKDILILQHEQKVCFRYKLYLFSWDIFY